MFACAVLETIVNSVNKETGSVGSALKSLVEVCIHRKKNLSGSHHNTCYYVATRRAKSAEKFCRRTFWRFLRRASVASAVAAQGASVRERTVRPFVNCINKRFLTSASLSIM